MDLCRLWIIKMGPSKYIITNYKKIQMVTKQQHGRLSTNYIMRKRKTINKFNGNCTATIIAEMRTAAQQCSKRRITTTKNNNNEGNYRRSAAWNKKKEVIQHGLTTAPKTRRFNNNDDALWCCAPGQHQSWRDKTDELQWNYEWIYTFFFIPHIIVYGIKKRM